MAFAVWQATITDDAGNIVPNAAIEVLREIAGQPPAQCYSDRNGATSIGSTFNADADGFVRFYVADGTYQITATSGAFTRVWRDVSVARPMPLVTRDRLTDDRTYYVRTDGSDSNTGLADSAGGAFLTIQKAIEVAAGLDVGIYNVTIQVRDGSYTVGGAVVGPWLGSGIVSVVGNLVSPGNVQLTVTEGNCFQATAAGRLKVGGMKLSTVTSGSCLNSATGALIESAGPLIFGDAAERHINSTDNGNIALTHDYTIDGDAGNHFGIINSSTLYIGATITLTGAPAFDTFCLAVLGGMFYAAEITFSGSATGTRYSVETNSAVDTEGGGADFFPGDSAGSVSTGGQYQ